MPRKEPLYPHVPKSSKLKEPKRIDQDYLESFFGDTRELSGISDTELKTAISQLRKIWIRIGDYKIGIDPSAQEIFRYTRQQYPK